MKDDGEKYWGKYRGTVKENVDPDAQGRLLVQVLDVSSEYPSTWAMPCLPIAGRRSGFFALPTVGSQVWVEYENGNSDHPIWVGCFWGERELPSPPPETPPGAMAFRTPFGNAITASDLPLPTGTVVLQCSSGAALILDAKGVTIKSGKGATITMSGDTVDINSGALTVR